MKNSRIPAATASLIFCLSGYSSITAQTITAQETRVVIESDGWKIVGDLIIPKSKGVIPAVILLNRAAGDRNECRSLCAHLADRGIASLRVDLRGHGESINKGKFVPFDSTSRRLMIEPSHEDVTAVCRYLKSVAGIDSQRIVFHFHCRNRFPRHYENFGWSRPFYEEWESHTVPGLIRVVDCSSK
ncbi:hypothetical protein L0337_23935 [candidate division KSB1 bacterium]|nr:hypothetical protein [candidate division KSB1 bacterium]